MREQDLEGYYEEDYSSHLSEYIPEFGETCWYCCMRLPDKAATDGSRAYCELRCYLDELQSYLP